jgi:phosphoenolpyruvate carboxylase
MRKRYQTLDEYLDDLDAIKEELAENIRGLNAKEFEAHFAAVQERFEQKMKTIRPRPPLPENPLPSLPPPPDKGKVGRKYQTLAEYLDDLDQIKARLAEETKGMSAQELEARFAQTHKRFEKKMKQLEARQSSRKKKPRKPSTRS